MTAQIRIAPSILSADLVRLREQVTAVEQGGADWIHVDVMDGHFVPNLTFGADMVAALRRITDLPLDVHLMVERPGAFIDAFADAGASVFTFHPEATGHVQRQLDAIRSRGMLAGLALNPGTPVSFAEEVVGDLDLLLVMTVNPGFAAQAFLGSSPGKIARARHMLEKHGSQAYLEVDGGIATETIARAYTAGADTFVAGSAIFSGTDPAREVEALRRCCLTVV